METENRKQPEPRIIRYTGPVTPYLFLAPYLVLFGTFVVLPAIQGLWISLHDWDFLLPRRPWVGLRNYQQLFMPDSRDFADFWQSMQATGLFTLFSVPFLVTVPLLVALLLNREFPGRTFFRAVYFAPYVLGVAVVGVLWRFLLDPNIGLVNSAMSWSIPWITALPWAWVSLVGMTVWWTLGFNAIIYLAGLQDIPRELYEAATVDGANRWQQFLHVTLPGLRPVLLFVLTTTLLGSANMFGQSYLITRGAPGNETRTAIMLIGETGLRSYRMGNAAAMSYVLALVLLGVGAVNFRLLARRDT